MKSVIGAGLAVFLILLGYFFYSLDNSNQDIKKDNLIKEVISENKVVLKEESKSVNNEIQEKVKNKVKEKVILVETKEKELSLDEKLFNIALDDLTSIHGDSDTSADLLEKEALVLSQLLKVKIYYEKNLESFSDEEYDSVFSKIDNSQMIYDDLLTVSLDCDKFSMFFNEYQQRMKNIQ